MPDFTKLDLLLRDLAEHKVPGCACAVYQDEKPIYEGYYGSANIAAHRPVTADTLYRQASMSKLVTYTIVMMLWEQGKLRMDQPLTDFFPGWANKKKFVTAPDGTLTTAPLENPILVHHAVTMTMGMPYCMGPARMDTKDPVALAMSKALEPVWALGHHNLQQEIEAIAPVPVAFEPGTDWMYGFGSELVGGIVEQLTGMQLSMAMRKYIFEPLGMKDTDSLFRDDLEQRLTTMYYVTPDGFKEAPAYTDRSQHPGVENENGRTSVMTTARDFSRMMQLWAQDGVLEGKRFLKKETMEFMRTNVLSGKALKSYQPGNEEYGYGYGVRTLLAPAEGCGSVGSYGWSGGHGTWCEADPVRHISIVYLHNCAPSYNETVHTAVRKAAYAAFE